MCLIISSHQALALLNIIWILKYLKQMFIGRCTHCGPCVSNLEAGLLLCALCGPAPGPGSDVPAAVECNGQITDRTSGRQHLPQLLMHLQWSLFYSWARFKVLVLFHKAQNNLGAPQPQHSRWAQLQERCQLWPELAKLIWQKQGTEPLMSLARYYGMLY